jgi:hypothetical protein
MGQIVENPPSLSSNDCFNCFKSMGSNPLNSAGTDFGPIAITDRALPEQTVIFFAFKRKMVVCVENILDFLFLNNCPI